MTQESAVHPTLDKDRAVVAFGVALLSTAIVISTFYSRIRGDLDWSNYTVGLLASAGLLGISLAAFAGIVTPRGVDETTDLAAWPGAFGTVGVGLMLAVAVNDFDTIPYYSGLSVVALSMIGFALSRRGPFVVSAILGLSVAVAQLFSDTIGFASYDESGELNAIWTAVMLVVFAALVTAAGWPFATRAVSGVVVGVLTVAGFAYVTQMLAIFGAFSSYDSSYDDYVSDLPNYDVDVWVILGLALLLMVGWAGCAAVSGHVGFRVLIVAMAVVVTPMAMFALQASHPTWWGVVLAAVGGMTLLGVLVGSRRRADVAPDAREVAPGP